MTVDAVGGVWRYAVDLAAGLHQAGVAVVFAGQGPQPSPAQRAEAEAVGAIRWLEEPLDWMAANPGEIAGVPRALARLADREQVDLLHLNLPSQACGLQTELPVVAVSHSCTPTWFRAVKGVESPPGWAWQARVNQRGFGRADRIVAPSRSHAAALAACYRGIGPISVVHNASKAPPRPALEREPFVFAAGRWWDAGKNAEGLDAAAGLSPWPIRMAGAVRGPAGETVALRSAEHLGSLDHAAVLSLVARAGIFASPSLYEPFGLAALEAAMTGAPLVLADIPTYRELWSGAALFASPHDPAAFASAIGRLAADPVARSVMGERARSRALRYSSEAQRDAMLAVYGEALEARYAPPVLTAAE